MRQILKQIGSGLSVALVTILMYGFVVLSFSALLLLVISMEEGVATLTDQSVGFAASALLYGQGVGIRTSAMSLTLVPWGICLALIALVRAIAAHTRQSGIALVSAVCAWDVLQYWFMQLALFERTDSIGVALAKTSAVMIVGYVLAWMYSDTPLHQWLHNWWTQKPVILRKMARSSLILATSSCSVLAFCGLVTLCVWIYRGQDAVVLVWQQLGMDTGSRVLTSVLCIIWLPNLLMWAVSWLAGGGFTLGTLAHFTMWSDAAQHVPAIPLFAIFPQAVEHSAWRIIAMLIPAITCFIVLCVMLFSHKYYRIVQPWEEVRLALEQHSFDWKGLLLRLGMPLLMAFGAIINIAVVVTLCALASNGSLGLEQLNNLGVNIAQTTGAIVRPSAVGCFAAWLVSMVALSGQYVWVAIRLRMLSHNKDKSDKYTQDDNRRVSNQQTEQKEQESEQTVSVPRTVSSNIQYEKTENSPHSDESASQESHTSRPARSVTSVPIDPSM